MDEPERSSDAGSGNQEAPRAVHHIDDQLDELPEFLYHYTDASGVKGILESRSLWATDARFLNDTTELIFARERVIDALIESADRLAPARPEGRWETREEQHAEVQRIAAALYEKTTTDFGVFVTSFSEHPDSLSQWRAYGTYSLVFRSSRLESISANGGPPGYARIDHQHPAVSDDHVPVRLRKVRYGHGPESAKLIADAVDAIKPGGIGIGAKAWVQLHYQAFPRLAALKHPTFEGEGEWRLIVGGYSDPTGIAFRASGPVVVPHVPLDFHPTAVAGVMVGPHARAELMKEGVKRLLSIQGYKDATVQSSTAPFRG